MNQGTSETKSNMTFERVDFAGVGFELLLDPGVVWEQTEAPAGLPRAFVSCSVRNAHPGALSIGRTEGIGVRWNGEQAHVEGVGFEAQISRVAPARYAARVMRAEAASQAGLLEALSSVVVRRERELSPSA